MFFVKRDTVEAEVLKVYKHNYETLKQENTELKEEVTNLKLTVSDLKLALAEAQSMQADLYREIKDTYQ